MSEKIAFLATGDEIVIGDILNTNTPKLAQLVYEQGFEIGAHLSCGDDLSALIQSLSYLLEHHDIVITVGGLGPTEDDNTAQAIAKVSNREMCFCSDAWQRIYQRISQRFDVVPENNKKQAYFPEGAQIIVNDKGTADGCELTLQSGKRMIMLPGPPHECLAMFEQKVLLRLKQLQSLKDKRMHYWQLIGASEAHISNELKPLAERYGYTLGYRAAYPYLEIKLHAGGDAEELIKEIESVIEPYVALKGKHSASKALKQILAQNEIKLNMQQDASKGYVYSQLACICPKRVSSEPRLSLDVKLRGMNKFWHDNAYVVDDIVLFIEGKDHRENRHFAQELHVRFSNKGKYSFVFIYEWVCSQLVRLLRKERLI